MQLPLRGAEAVVLPTAHRQRVSTVDLDPPIVYLALWDAMDQAEALHIPLVHSIFSALPLLDMFVLMLGESHLSLVLMMGSATKTPLSR